MEGIIVVVVILSIVLILLYLGGVLKFRGGFGWLPILLYSVLIITIFLLPILQRFGYVKIFPDNPEELFRREEFKGFKIYQLPQPVCKVLSSLNISESISCYMPALLYFFILPFAAIYVITWAFLKQLKIFEGVGRPIEALIAFIITFMTLPMGIFILLVASWFSILGAFSVAIFVAMFLAGAFFRGYGFIKAEKYSIELKILAQKAKEARQKFEELLKKVDALPLEEIKNKLKNLREEYEGLKAVTSTLSITEIDTIQDKQQAKEKIREVLRGLS
ncbi:MAG: hypothetical protein QXT34_03460 [Candidatus Aenigmatarchaeota archaeon]